MATKIKDGLFIGDAEASQDPEFIELNKITFVINCAGRQLPNLWEQHGLHYLTFPWGSGPDCVLFDDGNIVIEQITNFINEALEKGDSVLVHSLDGTGRCIACLTAYLMFRHRWGFEKALDFVCSKRPDAAPNPGFIQQLYHLDLRLCAQWFGPGVEPPEKDRTRHDQWVPLSPSSVKMPDQLQQKQSTDVRVKARRRDSTTSENGRGQSGASKTPVAVGRSVSGVASLPSVSASLALSGLSEVQEEELVLVHSFLNSQPQISALPPGRANHEDHVPKELHWIDRPRIDKLVAAGRLDADKGRPHLVPVSPGTGRPVPERPANSSYNALSQDARPFTSKGSCIVGILKWTKKARLRRTTGDDDRRTEMTQPSISAVTDSDAREVDIMASGYATAAASTIDGELTGEANEPVCAQLAGDTAVGDEVVVEDLSEDRSEQPSCTSITDGGEGSKSFHDDDGWRQEAHRGKGRPQTGGSEDSSLGDDAVNSDTVAPDTGTTLGFGERSAEASKAHCTPLQQHISGRRQAETENHVSDAIARAYREGRNGEAGQSPEKASNRARAAFDLIQEASLAPIAQGPGATRHDERQAWDGSTGPETDGDKSCDHDRRSSDKHHGDMESPRRQTLNNGDTKKNVARHTPMALASSLDQPHREPIASEDPSRTKTTSRWSGAPGASDHNQSDRDVLHYSASGSRANGGSGCGGGRRNIGGTEGMPATEAAKLLLAKPKSRRPGSKRSLTFIGSEVASYLPQEPREERVSLQAKMVPADPPGPGWGQQMEGDAPATGDRWNTSMSGKREGGGGETEVSDQDLYLAESGGGSLQQLAQTPNPQQRRLPSPRPQQTSADQEMRTQDSSDPIQRFAQSKRPQSAPSRRPDQPEPCDGPEGTPNDRKPTNGTGLAEAKAGVRARRVGTANQGYPVHRLMPSCSAAQLYEEVDRSQWGNGFRPRPLQMPVGTGNGRSTGSNGDGVGGGGSRHRAASVTSSPMGRGSHASTESLRLARMSSTASTEVEVRTAGGHPSNREQGSSGGGPLPREIRRVRGVSSTSSTDPSRARRNGRPASPANDKSSNASTAAHMVLAQPYSSGGSRRGLGSGGGMSMCQAHSGLVRSAGGTLPCPSRRGSSDSGTDGESDRWATPAPRGRQRVAPSDGAVAYRYAGAVSSTSSGGGSSDLGGGRVDGLTGPARSSRNPTDVYSTSLSYRPEASSCSGGPGSRVGGAPTYRAGSPAPTRGRRNSFPAKTSVVASAAADSSMAARFSQRNNSTQGDARHLPASAMPSAFKSYVASTIGSGGGVGVGGAIRGNDSAMSGGSRRRGHSPSPTAASDRRRTDRGSFDRSSSEQRSSILRKTRDVPSHGQRPSTSAGLPGGGEGEGGRQRRSPSPAPRPSSASGRRRASSSSPGANGLGSFIREAQRMSVSIDTGIDRPRWK